MLHRFFHRNAPYSLIGLITLLLLLTLPILIDTPPLTIKEIKWIALGKWAHHPIQALTYNNAPPLAMWIFGFLDLIFGSSPVMRKIMALLILFFEVIFFSGMIVRKKIFGSPTYIPAVVIGLLVLFSFDTISLTPDLFASVFLLLALEQIINEVAFGVDRRNPAFMTGLYLGLASLCVFWYGLYLIATLIVLAISSGLSARKAMSLVLAFLFPPILFLILLAYFNCAGNFIHYYYQSNFSSLPTGGLSWSSLFWVSLAPICFFGISWLQLLQRKTYSLFHSHVTLIMLLWIMTSLVIVSFSEKYPHVLIVCMPPISLLLTTYIVGLQRKRWMEILLWIFLFSLSFSLYWWRYKPQNKVDYSLLYPIEKYSDLEGKKVLALCAEQSLYLKNKPATSLINWEISENIFRAPQYYENQVAVAEAFLKEYPEIVIDPENLLASFLARQPHLRKRYKRQGDYWVFSN